jgi:metallophosphoesterase (TIGR00282 family)
MNILFIGDIVGKSGRQAVINFVPEIKKEFNVQFVIANAENCAGGNGTNSKCIEEMNGVVNAFTMGDHTWDQKGFESEITRIDNLVRPANFHQSQPGKGFGIFRNAAGGEVAVISLMGKVFMRDSAYCPFETVDKILKNDIPASVKNIFVDFHAEATSEKLAMGYFLDGRVTAVLGTHTHVQTNDGRILANGTAMLTDVGMVGGDTSVLGREVDDVLNKFTSGMPGRLNVVEKGLIRLDGAIISYNYQTGKAEKIQTISRYMEV